VDDMTPKSIRTIKPSLPKGWSEIFRAEVRSSCNLNRSRLLRRSCRDGTWNGNVNEHAHRVTASVDSAFRKTEDGHRLCSRHSSSGWTLMLKKSRKGRVGRAATNGKKLSKRNASAVAKGAAYAVLAGRPSKQAVIPAFGKTGYALSWVVRADRLEDHARGTVRAFQDGRQPGQEVVGRVDGKGKTRRRKLKPRAEC
jgi:hypothetical protein